MSNNNNNNWESMDLTHEEMDRMSSAFKKDEFKKMFFDYCDEIQDPENRKRYEEEIIQLEAERGVEVTFLNPEPGFVVKTSVDGKMKGFLNISMNDKLEKPTSEMKRCNKSGKMGLSWSIPYAQAPPHHEYDNKNVRCLVYDVLFHPDALHLSLKNTLFRKHLIDTACDAVEREFKVKLDRANLKFPKMNFKGTPKATIMRKLSQKHMQSKSLEPNPLESYLPPIPKNEQPKIVTSNGTGKIEDYTIPNYVIKHSKGVDLTELTNELDSKLNLTIPKELVVDINLPLLNSTSDCTLDVTERKLYLRSEQPAKYKLNIDLPYSVNDSDGSAKFDRSTRMLSVRLPVSSTKEKKLRDLYREDSGVESDVKDDNGSISPNLTKNNLIEILSSENNSTPNQMIEENNETSTKLNKFLNDSILYNFPTNFDCNTLDDDLAFTLHVKNVDPNSVEQYNSTNYVHLKFASIGSGYYPVHYSFFVQLPQESAAIITSVDVEPWDNNIILTLSLANYENLKNYAAGLHEKDLKEYEIFEEFTVSPSKFAFSQEKDNFEVTVQRPSELNQVEIEIYPISDENMNKCNQQEHKKSNSNHNNNNNNNNKRQKKKNKKRRSLSESYCDEIHASKQEDSTSLDNSGKDQSSPTRKIRSFSESRSNDSSATSHKDFKGILKHHSRYGRSISESCSSFDDHIYSCSATDSFNDIPEEGSELHEFSESCKKTVRFSDVIRKQLFRMDSSILGQRKKNQKRKSQKQRAIQRRNSEGDSVDYEDKSSQETSLMDGKVRKTSQHDSGLDLSIEGMDSNAKDFSEKNGLIFDIEI